MSIYRKTEKFIYIILYDVFLKAGSDKVYI